MEGLTKNSRLSRQGSRVRRHRSQEWQDYSSSDNEDHHHVDSRAYRYPTADEPYEEQRASENRKHGLVCINLHHLPSSTIFSNSENLNA
ncbi:uncharacterized protein TNIN_250371 [Trichonephila inaurata madagascariensis]|uniref:Uncharacterized protein n=1 Tax=Trichonephila inaurata madagascariensis TaxID=2747483 RepID=A0A8X6XH76_9ARAC|nr:uncharacterized protein TNIN_250371 [Trichonephila inaurata madagascariensis]